MSVRFWGVRGSTPTPQRDNLGYGGNTSCVEVRTDGNEILILDGGTGIRLWVKNSKRNSTVREFGLMCSSVTSISITFRAFPSSHHSTRKKITSPSTSQDDVTQTW